jgi:hypothetical protein
MKKVVIIIAVLFVIIAGGLYYYKKWRHDFVRHKVPELVFLKSDSLYRITYDSVDIDEIAGEITINNLHLQPDTTYKRISNGNLPTNLLEVKVEQLRITGLKTDKALLNKEIIADKVKLSRPIVTIFKNELGPATPKTKKTAVNEVYKAVLRQLEHIGIDTILISNADYRVCNWSKEDTFLAAKSIDAQLFNLDISDSTSTDTSRVLFAKKAELTVGNMLLKSKKKPYEYRLTDLVVHSATKVFAIRNMFVIPLLSEPAFMRNSKLQTDRLDFELSDIRFRNINVQELLNANILADTLNIERSSFKIFRDLSYPRDKLDRTLKFPQQQLTNSPISIALKTVVLQHAYVEYKEKNPKSDSSGKVRFYNTKAIMHNVTNREEDILHDSICTVFISTNLLNGPLFAVSIRFNLKSSHGKFSVDGSLGAADASLYAQLSKPMGLVSVDKGFISSLHFNLYGDDYYCRGNLILLYQGLKVSLLKKDNEDNEYKKKLLASFLANKVVINDNPKKKKDVRKATIFYPRDTNRSWFSLVWKSIFSGVKQTVGM